MLNTIMTRTTPLLLAVLLALSLAACEEDSSSGSSLSEQSAAMDASGAVGSALDNALESEEETGGQGLSENAPLPGRINRALGHIQGFRSVGTPGGAINQASASGGPIAVSFSGTFDCTSGGTVGVVGDAQYTFSWNDGAGVDLAFWHQTWEITGMDMTLNDCGEDGYTLNGTAAYATTQTGEFDQSAEDSPDYDFLLDFTEDSSADIVATHEASGADFDLALSWQLDATLTGTLNVLSGASEIETVDATGIWTANDWTCEATWTDPNGDWQVSCSNN